MSVSMTSAGRPSTQKFGVPSPEGRQMLERELGERYQAMIQKLYCLRSALFAIHSQVADKSDSWVSTVQNSLALVFPQCSIYITLPPDGAVGDSVFTERMLNLIDKTRLCKQLVVENADEDAETGEIEAQDGGHCLCAPIKDADDHACGVILLCNAATPFEMDDEEFMLLLCDQINLSYQWLHRGEEIQQLLRNQGEVRGRNSHQHSSFLQNSAASDAEFKGAPYLRQSHTTPTSRDTSGNSRRAIGNVRANTTYNSRLSHLLHSSAANTLVGSNNNTNRLTNRSTSMRRSLRATAAMRNAAAAIARANSTPLRNTENIDQDQSLARHSTAAENAIKSSRSPDLRLSDFLQSPVVRSPASARQDLAPVSTSNTPLRTKHGASSPSSSKAKLDVAPPVQAIESKEANASSQPRTEKLMAGDEQQQPENVQRLQASPTKVLSDFKNVSADTKKGTCFDCTTLRRRLKLQSKQWEAEKASLLARIRPEGSPHTTTTKTMQSNPPVPGRKSKIEEEREEEEEEEEVDAFHDIESDESELRANSRLLDAIEDCVGSTLLSSSSSSSSNVDNSDSSEFRQILAAVRIWSTKLGFPTVRIYRVLGCDEDVTTEVPSDGCASASYYEVTSSSNVAWPRNENRPDDAHDVRPVRWDGLVGDAINILRQSGQSQLRYQRHIFYPIRSSRQGGSTILPLNNDGALRAVLRVEDSSLLGHGIARRRKLFQRWLNFVRRHAACNLLLLEGRQSPPSRLESTRTAGLSHPLLKPILQRASRAVDDQALALNRVRNHKRVFEFTKALLQLTFVKPPSNSRSKNRERWGMQRVSQHVSALAAQLGVTNAPQLDDGVVGASILVWWRQHDSDNKARFWTCDWHPAFGRRSAGGMEVSRSGRKRQVWMSRETATRHANAYEQATIQWAQEIAKGSKRTQHAFKGRPCFEYAAPFQSVGHFVGDHRVGSALEGIVEVVFPEHFAAAAAAAAAGADSNDGTKLGQEQRKWWANMLHFLTYISGVLSAWTAAETRRIEN